MRERHRPPEDIPPADFFTRWICDSVDADADRRAMLGDTRATIEFELTGDGGGFFSLVLAEGRVSGREGPCQDADLRVRVGMETWRALNRGSISAPEALLRRQVTLRGKFLLALKLHLILG